jgi:hypothetical protein
LIAGRYWLTLGAGLCAVAMAGQPPAPPPPSGPPQSTSAEAPDEEFIEFLGEDDHGDDAAWREFLKNAPPGTEKQTAPPPQDTKQ